MPLKTKKPQLGDLVEAHVLTGGGKERVLRGEVTALLAVQFVLETEPDRHEIIRYDGDWRNYHE